MRLLYACLFLLSVAFPTNAAVWFVDLNATGANDGTSWTDAYTDLHDGLAAADSLDEVWVAAGSHFPHPTTRSVSYVIPNGVSIYGGFVGGETMLSERDWVTNVTRLNGNIGLAGINSDNTRNVVVAGADCTIDGFLINQGFADGSTGETQRGAAIYAAFDNLTVRNCTFNRNKVIDNSRGGAIYIAGANALIEDCDFFQNEALGTFGLGGAVFTPFSSTIYRRTSFRENQAGSDGGAVHFGLLAEDCTFLDNQGRFGAGSYWVDTVRTCYFEGNTGTGGGGGLAYGYEQTDNEFNSNTAAVGGGSYGTSYVARGLYYDNVADAGGGIYVSTAQNLVSSLLYSNDANEYGGGVFGVTNTTNGVATNVTIADNTALISGGGVAGSLTLRNSILWGNTAPSEPAIDDVSLVVRSRVSYSVVQGSGGSGAGWLLAADAFDDGDNIDADPLFTNPGAGNYRIAHPSPAYGGGSNALVLGTLDLDNGARVQGGRVDMGAYEAPVAVAVTGPATKYLRAYPNPFNPVVTIEFRLASRVPATVTIYNAKGQLVRTLFEGPAADAMRVSWDGTNNAGRYVGTGVYFARLAAPGVKETKKLVLVK